MHRAISNTMSAVIPFLPDVPLPLVLAVLFGSLGAIVFLRRHTPTPAPTASASSAPAPARTTEEKPKTKPTPAATPSNNDEKKKQTMTTTAAEPQSAPAPTSQLQLTAAELAKYDNHDASLPVYVAIKGTIFDVSSNRAMYPHNEAYGQFAGKDASRALAKSSLNKADCVATWEDLPPEELKVLDDWLAFYTKKYPIVGKVVTE
ncbi:hypothetical protein H9P43_004022 [Blastocladiella emersonii ATCC 22665]|nr:hypothetical protein H9P43_004022 [Blastocladiella emersonii ATCC 22665]